MGQRKRHAKVSQLTRGRIPFTHSDASGLVSDLACEHQTEMIMFKTLIATLILATASVALTSKVNAGPKQATPTQAESNYFDRASKIWDGGAQ